MAAADEIIKSFIKKYTKEYEFNYKFYDNDNDKGINLMRSANALSKPVMVIAPEGNGDDLRVWTYGGCIATISTETGHIHFEDKKAKMSDSQIKNNKSLGKNPYKYGKYLMDGFMDGQNHIFNICNSLKSDYEGIKDDKLSIYNRYVALLENQKGDEIRELLNLSVYVAYTRWLCRKKGTPKYAGEKFMQCVIAKNSMLTAKFDKDDKDRKSMVVVDVEYHFKKNDNARADFVVFDGASFGLIEFKYLGKSMTSKTNSILKHYNDFDREIGFGKDVRKQEIIGELTKKTELLCKYGILDASWEAAIEEFKKKEYDSSDLWCGFYFLGTIEDISKSNEKDNNKEDYVKAQISAQLKGKYDRRINARCQISKVSSDSTIDVIKMDIPDIKAVWSNNNQTQT